VALGGAFLFSGGAFCSSDIKLFKKYGVPERYWARPACVNRFSCSIHTAEAQFSTLAARNNSIIADGSRLVFKVSIAIQIHCLADGNNTFDFCVALYLDSMAHTCHRLCLHTYIVSPVAGSRYW
jgi:hypothetical protein